VAELLRGDPRMVVAAEIACVAVFVAAPERQGHDVINDGRFH
jgi:hypothetical protein